MTAAQPFAEAACSLATAASDLLARNRAADAADDDVARAMTAVARLFVAKAEHAGSPSLPVEADALTATETVTLVSALLRAANLNVFDLAMWFRRAS